MTTFHEHAESDCPISPESLIKLYRSDRALIADAVRHLSSHDKAQLALFCYGRSHLREIGLEVAACCDARALALVAGVLGQVLAAQSRGRIAEFGKDGVRAGSTRSKVSLARAAA